nr:MAG TPA: hypothetical protein [Caudoviricetes sp.]
MNIIKTLRRITCKHERINRRTVIDKKKLNNGRTLRVRETVIIYCEDCTYYYIDREEIKYYQIGEPTLESYIRDRYTGFDEEDINWIGGRPVKKQK